MTTELFKNSDKQVARPLREISAEIKRVFKEGKAAAEEVWRPHEERIGLLLIEAKTHFPDGKGFPDWFEAQDFGFSYSTGKRWRQFATSLQDVPDFVRDKIFSPTEKPLRVSHIVDRHGYVNPSNVRAAEMARIHREATANAERFMAKRRDLAKEIALIKAIALKIIDAGYKVLATKMHPDKGGSHDAQRRLNAARAKLKQALNFITND